MEKKKTNYYYLGANSPDGFFSYYDHLIDLSLADPLYVIKGGPGTGKSSFMRKFGKTFEEKGCAVDYITCSSDPDSLDGVVLHDLSVAFVDGTSPHVIDPIYPACSDEIINMGDYWNKAQISKNKSQVIDLSKKISDCFKSAYNYLSGIKGLDQDLHQMIHVGIQDSRLFKLGERLIKAHCKGKAKTPGKASARFISGITPKGINPHFENITQTYETIYRMDDDFGIGSRLLAQIADAAQMAGYDVIKCYCPSAPKTKLDHLMIPNIQVAFVTSNTYHPYTGDYVRKVNLDRYIDEDVKKANRQKIRFNKKLKKQLVNSAIDCVKEAKDLHDTLETCYIPHMDHKKIDAFQKKIEDKLLTRLAKKKPQTNQ